MSEDRTRAIAIKGLLGGPRRSTQLWPLIRELFRGEDNKAADTAMKNFVTGKCECEFSTPHEGKSHSCCQTFLQRSAVILARDSTGKICIIHEHHFNYLEDCGLRQIEGRITANDVRDLRMFCNLIGKVAKVLEEAVA